MQIEEQKIKIGNVLFFPLFFIACLWVIKYAEFVFNFSLAEFGVYPRNWKGIMGVLTAPLIHADSKHLLSNSIPLVVLGGGMFYFYRLVAYRVFTFVYLASGFWVWVSARPAFHIGASGLVYGLAAFIFFSGLIRKNKYLMAFSLFVVFVYGSMVWGVLPLQIGISWESHLMGAIAGISAAVYYKKIGLQKETYDWEKDDNDNEYEEWTALENTETHINTPQNTETKVIYHYKENGEAKK